MTSTNRIASHARGRLGRLFRSLIWIGAAALLLFHVGLFLSRVAGGQALAPAVALRWAAGGVLFLVLLWLRRLGVPLLWGRRAVVFWLLVLFLHATAQVPGVPAPDALEAPAAEFILVVVPAAVSIGLMAGALLVLAFLRQADASPLASSFAAVRFVPNDHGIGRSPAVSPRPPPFLR